MILKKNRGGKGGPLDPLVEHDVSIRSLWAQSWPCYILCGPLSAEHAQESIGHRYFHRRCLSLGKNGRLSFMVSLLCSLVVVDIEGSPGP